MLLLRKTSLILKIMSPAVTEHYINLLVISLTSPYRQESGSFLPSWAPGPSTLGQRRGLDPASLLSPRSSQTCPERGPGGQVQRKPSSFARGVGRLEAPSGGLRTSRRVWSRAPRWVDAAGTKGHRVLQGTPKYTSREAQCLSWRDGPQGTRDPPLEAEGVLPAAGLRRVQTV